MTSDPIWKVFVPCDVFKQPNSYLIGQVTKENQSYYITASSCDFSAANQLPGHDLIGFWSGEETETPKSRTNKRHENWINVWKDENADIQCEVFSNTTTCQCTLFIYKPSDLLRSETLRQKAAGLYEENDCVTSLVRILHRTNSCLSGYEIANNITVYISMSKVNCISQWMFMFLTCFVNFIYLPLKICHLPMQR